MNSETAVAEALERGDELRGCVIVGPEASVAALTTTVAGGGFITVRSSITPTDAEAPDPLMSEHLSQIARTASSYVIVADPPSEPRTRRGALENVERWGATTVFRILQTLLPHLREPGRSVVMVGGADGFAASPGTVRGAVESQALMAMNRVLAEELAPGGRSNYLAVDGDVVDLAVSIGGASRYLLSSRAAHITGQSWVISPSNGVLR